jgi:two-component system nitrogen regulation response regulator NtrX
MSAPRILAVDDEQDILALLREILSEEGYAVDTATNAEEARQAREAAAYDLVLLDIWLPDSDGVSLLREWAGRHTTPVIMISGHATIDVALEASRWGAVDVLEKPISLRRLLSAVAHALGSRIRVEPLPPPPPILLDPAWGRSPTLRALREALAPLARLPVETLLIGEQGSGREEIARALHERAQRRGAFVRCLPGDLESERLFEDRLREAATGTLYFERLETLGAASQERLLARLASSADEERGLRFLISAATPELGRRVARGELAPDLLERLGRRILTVPALRDYRDDIPELVGALTERLIASQELPYRRFSVAALNLLRQQEWPGNLRQFRNALETILHEAREEEIGADTVQACLARRLEAARPTRTVLGEDWLGLSLREARELFERAYFEELLRRCDGRIGRVAEASGMERTHLYRKLRSLGIQRENFGSDEA